MRIYEGMCAKVKAGAVFGDVPGMTGGSSQLPGRHGGTAPEQRLTTSWLWLWDSMRMVEPILDGTSSASVLSRLRAGASLSVSEPERAMPRMIS